EAGREPQKFGLGVKELWEVSPRQHRPGLIQHTIGWPLDDRTGGGSFLYHYGRNRVSVGFVVHLNYANPYVSPYEELQRFKTHPLIRATLADGTRIGYGARVITEGGWQSIPKLVFPGGLLVGCAAGLVNVPRIKGSHNAIWSGIHAAEAIGSALAAHRAHDVLDDYERAVKTGPIARDLKPVRNAKPLLSKCGTLLGTLLSGVDMWLNTIVPGGGLGYTLKHGKPDCACMSRAGASNRIEYGKADGVLTFERLTDLAFSGTNHEEDQPVHIKLADPTIPIRVNLPVYAEPAQRYCPAGVFEIVRGGTGALRFQINAQNCVHCKACDIKDPSQNITWTVPEGGGGPNYVGM
ncbi:MAG TPA: electron transfer flavoprotein-ubiquinone oxidoreductase, partial [Steroidobacteraceae bacterium]